MRTVTRLGGKPKLAARNKQNRMQETYRRLFPSILVTLNVMNKQITSGMMNVVLLISDNQRVKYLILPEIYLS